MEGRLAKRLLQARFNLLKCLLESAAARDSRPQVRAKSVKALGEVVKVDARLLSMQQVAMCLRTAMHVRTLRQRPPVTSINFWSDRYHCYIHVFVACMTLYCLCKTMQRLSRVLFTASSVAMQMHCIGLVDRRFNLHCKLQTVHDSCPFNALHALSLPLW